MNIVLTESAAQKIKEIMIQEKLDDGMALRVKVVGAGCSGFSYDLYFDTKQPNDLSYNSCEITILVDNMSILYLEGSTIDYVDGLMGAGFKFNNPNTSSVCACGSSFSV